MFTFNQLDGLLNSIQKDNDMFNSTSRLSFSPTFSQYYIDGILGGDILKELKVIIDYPQKTLKLEKLFISL